MPPPATPQPGVNFWWIFAWVIMLAVAITSHMTYAVNHSRSSDPEIWAMTLMGISLGWGLVTGLAVIGTKIVCEKLIRPRGTYVQVPHKAVDWTALLKVAVPAFLVILTISAVALAAWWNYLDRYTYDHVEVLRGRVVIKQLVRTNARTGVTEVFDENIGWHLPQPAKPRPEIAKNPQQVEFIPPTHQPIVLPSPPRQPQRTMEQLSKSDLQKIQATVLFNRARGFIIRLHNGSSLPIAAIVVRVSYIDGNDVADYVFTPAEYEGVKPLTDKELTATATAFKDNRQWRWQIIRGSAYVWK